LQRPLKDFDSWANRYAAVSGTRANSANVAEGLRLAKERRSALLELMKSNPDRALKASIAGSTRKLLPAEIANELEVPVSGVGDFFVLCAIPPQGARTVEPIQRFVVLNGRTYSAFVYGRRVGEITKYSIPLHGVAVGDVLALDESVLV